jgi:hypothetical protein
MQNYSGLPGERNVRLSPAPKLHNRMLENERLCSITSLLQPEIITPPSPKYGLNASACKDGIISTGGASQGTALPKSFSSAIDDLLNRTVSDPCSRITCKDKMELGGSEYGAIKMLAYLIPAYFVTW